MKTTVLGLSVLGFCLAGAADAYQCEVLDLAGTANVRKASGETAPLAKGDLLGDGDTIETQEGAVVDLAFDGQWNNTVRVESSTSLAVAQAFPTRLEIAHGAVYAKLKHIPVGTDFEVAMPTAVASARGTEFRAHFAGGRASVYNFSDISTVYVYGVTRGKREEAPRPLATAAKIQMTEDTPAASPEPLAAEEQAAGRDLAKGIDAAIEQASAEGRQAKIPGVDELEQALGAKTEQPEQKGADLQEWHDLHVSAFAADMVLSGPQGTFSSRFYTTSGKSRMEMPGSISIVRLDRDVVYVLMPAEKMYIEQFLSPEMAAQAMTDEASIVSRKEIARETVEGRPATRYEVVLSAGGNTQTVHQWMIEGQPVPAKMAAADGSWTVEYRNVHVGTQPEDLFEVPDDYKKMDMPALPQSASELAAFQQAGLEQDKDKAKDRDTQQDTDPS